MRHGLLFILAAGCALAIGCSSPSGPRKGSKVTGKVSHNGKPVAGAKVVFTDGKDVGMMANGPSAVTDETGEYAVVGVPPGTYKVVVYKLIPKKGAVMPEEMDLEQIEASGLGVHALPKKYSNATTTTLTAEVAKGSNEGTDFELKGQ